MGYDQIIDIYAGNERIDLQRAWDRGVRAIIHKASEALDVTDSAYRHRKQHALEIGFLWGAYHLSSAQSAREQLDYFLNIENGSDPRILLALDWEQSKHQGIMTLDQVHEFVTLFHERLGRYPMLYGGHTVREAAEITQGDRLLANCPLWYQRYRTTPVDLPTATWPHYTIWQYDNEALQNGGYNYPETAGADWNRFDGDLAVLQAAWPFSRAVPQATRQIAADPRAPAN
jgi:lysozyme